MFKKLFGRLRKEEPEPVLPAPTTVEEVAPYQNYVAKWAQAVQYGLVSDEQARKEIEQLAVDPELRLVYRNTQEQQDRMQAQPIEQPPPQLPDPITFIECNYCHQLTPAYYDCGFCGAPTPPPPSSRTPMYWRVQV